MDVVPAYTLLRPIVLTGRAGRRWRRRASTLTPRTLRRQREMVKQLDRDTKKHGQRAQGVRQRPTTDEMPAGDRLLPTYEVPGDGLSMGASLGNSHCWITTKGRGEIDGFFSTDLGRIVMG